MTGLHVPSLFKTLLPLSIILQKTTCKTCHLEGGMQDSLKPSDVLPRFGPLDINQQQPKMKPFSSRWVNKVHPSNNIALLAWTPLSVLLVPHKVMGEVKIRNLLCSRKGLIGGEPLHKGSLINICEVWLCISTQTIWLAPRTHISTLSNEPNSNPKCISNANLFFVNFNWFVQPIDHSPTIYFALSTNQN